MIIFNYAIPLITFFSVPRFENRMQLAEYNCYKKFKLFFFLAMSANPSGLVPNDGDIAIRQAILLREADSSL